MDVRGVAVAVCGSWLKEEDANPDGDAPARAAGASEIMINIADDAYVLSR
jgi:hypothetical protein